MNLLTVTQIANAAGIPRHRARHLIDRWRIAHSATAANARVYHPWVVDWVRETLADQKVRRDRNTTRLEVLLTVIEQDKAAVPELVAADFGVAPLKPVPDRKSLDKGSARDRIAASG